jgi:DNA-binding Lrp family transcriptional regulator
MSSKAPRRRREGRPEATILEAIVEAGPRNLSSISKMTKIPVETVRYKLKRQFPRLGIGIRARPNYAKLGLNLFWATIGFGKEALPKAGNVLAKLGEIGYLAHHARLLPVGNYACLFTLPAGGEEGCMSLLKQLVKAGVLASFDMDEVSLSRHHSINPKYFDFRRGGWVIDWSAVDSEESTPLPRSKVSPVKVDRYDIVLVKELQLNAVEHTSGIARKLKMATPVLGYHYRTHLQGEGLIEGYSLRWTIPKKKRPGQSVIIARLRIGELNERQLQRAHEAVSKIPFTWSEYFTKGGTYLASMAVQTEELAATLNYLNERLSEFGTKLKIDFVRLEDSVYYPVPDALFEKGWKYKPEAVKDEVIRLVRGSK